MEPNIILFDLDGVLIKPGGYRAAFFTVIHEFLKRSGLDEWGIPADLPELFEADGITNEWDMLPITYAITLDAAFSISRPAKMPDSFLDVFSCKLNISSAANEIEYAKKLDFLRQFLSRRHGPAQDILNACLNGWQDKIFPRLTMDFIKDIFAFGFDLSQSEINILMQNHVLGDKLFSRVYERTPQVMTESYLKLYDQPNLETSQICLIKDLALRKRISPAIMTARPSLPPKNTTTSQKGYSPEAEIALSLLGLDEFPLIGYGHMNYMASQTQRNPNQLMKPVPYQALAAIPAAWQQDEKAGLETALRLFDGDLASKHGISRSELHDLPKAFNLHVLEDSMIGILSCQKALEILGEAGFHGTLHAWGIAQNPEKVRALGSVGAKVFANASSALEEMIQDL